MELRGVEPLASSMRPRRSSQLSYSPEGTVILPPAPVERCDVQLTRLARVGAMAGDVWTAGRSDDKATTEAVVESIW